MKTMRILGLAAVTALSLSAGAAMAQEGPNATVSGSTWFGNRGPVYQAPYSQAPTAGQGTIQSGSSDIDTYHTRPMWTPGVPYSNEAGEQ